MDPFAPFTFSVPAATLKLLQLAIQPSLLSAGCFKTLNCV